MGEYMYNFIAKGIKVDMFVGICDFEYLTKQRVIVNVEAHGRATYRPKNISECLDYSKVCAFVKAWEKRPHVDLVETLLYDVLEFLFKDETIQHVKIEILKPAVIDYADAVGVGIEMSDDVYHAIMKERNRS